MYRKYLAYKEKYILLKDERETESKQIKQKEAQYNAKIENFKSALKGYNDLKDNLDKTVHELTYLKQQVLQYSEKAPSVCKFFEIR
jgi:predicted nuclease with TOPRIM domain